MSADKPTDEELLSFLDESLPVERSSQVEEYLRTHSDGRQRAALLSRRRDQGGFTVGEIWRRQRLSCPSRTELGSYLLGVSDGDMEDYIVFHTDVIGCRFCKANLADLRAAQSQDEETSGRQQRYFETSAGFLRPNSEPE